MAEGALFEINNLSIGKVAPDIEGEDLDGKSFKLSDYRGKVVVLDFWGDCEDRVGLCTHTSGQLVKKLADKPFTIIGVNSDKDLEEIRGIVNKKNISWRSFWNGPEGTRRSHFNRVERF